MDNPIVPVGFDAKKPVPEAISMEEILPLAHRYTDHEDHVLVQFLYMTGCRITEALNTRVRDISWGNHAKLGEVLNIKLITLKNRKNKIRIIPVPMRAPTKTMVSKLIEWTDILGPDALIFSVSRNTAWNHLSKETITTRAIHGKEIIDKYTFKNRPHYMRHCRLTHLVQNYGFDALRLMRYAGWTDTKPAQVYLQLNWMDLAAPLVNRNGFDF